MTAHAGATFISLADTPFKGKKIKLTPYTDLHFSKGFCMRIIRILAFGLGCIFLQTLLAIKTMRVTETSTSNSITYISYAL